MTAEIAIMNAQAVALAADSAVTFGSKVKNTANKIFALSKFEPIAAMIYNNADFLGLPWETVVKAHRTDLSRKSFPTVRHYAANFFEYLKNERLIARATHNPRRMTEFVENEFRVIREAAMKLVEAEIASAGTVSESRIAQFLQESLKDRKKRRHDSAPKIGAAVSATVSNSLLERIVREVFDKLPLKAITRRGLKAHAHYLVRTFPVAPPSGFVVAGFGRDELYPSLESYSVYSFADDSFVAVRDDRSFHITVEESVYVVPFAQSEVVATFMDGVDPRYQHLIEGLIATILREYPSKILDQVTSLSATERGSLISRFEISGSQVATEYLKRLEEIRGQMFSGPITAVVQSLPKDELAAMAESLVNLTSFKRKVSLDQETVGGPIDVAVISKGDGLIWIKRKHYFEPKYNPQFFDLYYWMERYGQQEKSETEPSL